MNFSGFPSTPDPSDPQPPDYFGTEIAPPPPPPPKPWPAWSVWDVVALAFIFLLLIFTLGAVVPLSLRLLPEFRHASLGELSKSVIIGVSSQGLAYLLWLWPIWLVVHTKSGEPLMQAVRWRAPSPRQLVLLFGIGIFVTILMMLAAHFVPTPENAPFEEYFKNRRDAFTMAVFGVVFAPFFEELFFRGLLYPALKRSLRFVPALLLTSALFGLLHSFEWAFAWGPILIIFLVGVAITLVREYMDSLAASWIVHVVYNGSLLALQIISTHGFTQN